MSYYNQRIAILLFISLFVLQILVCVSAEKVDSGKVLTLSFDELDKEATATGSEIVKATSAEIPAEIDQQKEENKVVGKDQSQPQQTKPQLNEEDDYEDDYEYIEIVVDEGIVMDDDHMDDEALDDNTPQELEPSDNNPPPQELEPFVDEEEFNSSAASVDATSASMYEEGLYYL